MNQKRKKWIGIMIACFVVAVLALATFHRDFMEQIKDWNSMVKTNDTETKQVGCIMPLYPMDSAKDAFADGGYSVSFEAKEYKKTEQGYSLTVKVYDYDRYAMEDIQQLKVGDQIQVCRKPITVESIKNENGKVIINGGIESNGVELMEDDALYRTNTINDQPAYYKLGEIVIPVSIDCTFEDHVDLEKEPDGDVYDYDDIQAALRKSETPFNAYNTIITVRKEQVVQIIRYWIP